MTVSTLCLNHPHVGCWHVAPGFWHGRLQVADVWVLTVTGLWLNIHTKREIQGIQIWRTGRPNIFWPEIYVLLQPIVDGLSGVARSPILHQDDILVVGEVDPGEHVRLQDQFQVVLSPHSEARFEEDWRHFYPIGSDMAKHHYLLWLLKGFHFWRLQP